MIRYAAESSVDAIGLDHGVDPIWAGQNLPTKMPVQGNLDPTLMVSGGKKLVEETKKLRDQMSEGPYIFNLGHGITPDADPKNVENSSR